MTQIKVNDTVYGFWFEEQPQTICEDNIKSISETAEGFTYTLYSGFEFKNPSAFFTTKEALVADWLEANGVTFGLQAK
jgi:hypothetical protein